MTSLPKSHKFLPVLAFCSLFVGSGCVEAQEPTLDKAANGLAVNRPDIGVGLEGLSDWSRALMFSDAMKTSRRWGSPERPWEHTVKTDSLGWPTEDAGIVVIADTPNIGGTYALTFEGKADVRGHFNTKIENLTYDAAKNISTANVVVPESNNQLFLSFTGTQNGVRNVRLLRPNAVANVTFSKPFLDKVAPFSTLRFMDYLSTNNSPVKSWEERTTPAHASQAREQGGALEYVVELANLTDKDIWVNVPDQADENYIRQMALLLKNGLEPERKVYVEWSNEVWNWQFRQATRNLDAAKMEGKEANSPLAFDKDQNEGYWAMRRIAKRSVEVGKTFREVFGDRNFERVRPVYATQVGYEEVYKQGLAFLENQYKQPNTVIYGLAGAPYFQVSEELNKKPNLTVDEIFAAIPADMEHNLVLARTMSSYARFYGLKALAYEGGQHLQDHINAGNADVKVAANRDPRMGQAIETYLRGWNALGGDLFVYFTLTSGYSKWGSWGLVEDPTQSSPKFEAVMRVLNAPKAPVTAGVGISEELNGGEFIATNRWDKPSKSAVQLEPEKWFQYSVRATKNGQHTLNLQIATTETIKADILLNGKVCGVLEATPDKTSWSGPLPLVAGLNELRIRGTNGRFQLRSMQVERP
jgi:hypothetical protein